ncbi:MAG: hypothetical protein U9N11_07150 [Campylobacterota bacterium]|nr:hypothetical protein [Campylobacterota bacterium]
MIRKSILINFTLTLLFTLIFSGCVERGHTIELKQVALTQKTSTTDISMSSNINNIDAVPNSLDSNNVYNPDETSFELFQISDEVKNSISGFFVVAIGLIIILL